MTTILLLIAVLAPVVGTVIALSVGRSVARAAIGSTAMAAAAALVLVGLAATEASGVPAGLADLPDWVALGVDRVSAVLLVTVTGIALVIASFSRRSLDSDHPRSEGYYLAIAAVTTGSALVVVPGGPVPLLVGWVVSGRALVWLTRGWSDTADARAAQRSLRSSVWVGDLALAAALAVGVSAAGAGIAFGAPGDLDELASSTVLGVDATAVVAVLVVVAGAARSALVPFHRWLTATLYAPTPVSALVHAGLVSGAGLLLIRFAPTYVGSDVAIVLAIVLATATIAIGTVASLIRVDAKGSLAWSTVAQMAFMVLQCAIGAFAAAVFHIIGHGMYKAAQFLGVGDTVAAGLRQRRRPVRTDGLSRATRLLATVVTATVAVAIGVLVGPDGLQSDERILLVVFAWGALATAVHGFLDTRSLGRTTTVAAGALGATAASLAYFGAIGLVKRFLDPTLGATDVAVDTTAMVAVVAVISAAAALALIPGSVGDRWRSRVRWTVGRLTAVRTPLDLRAVDAAPARRGATAGADRGPALPVARGRADASHLQAQVARAAEIVAPNWPLASFVAVNPLGGLEAKAFDDAASDARRLLRGRTFRSLEQFRAEHDQGLTTSADLTYVAHDVAMVACGQAPVNPPGRVVEAIEVVLTDLLHGPEAPAAEVPRTALERQLGIGAAEALAIDDLVCEWLAAHVSPATWPLEPEAPTFVGVARRQAIRHARRQLDGRAVAWLESLPDDPTTVLAAALEQCGIHPTDCVEEIRGHLAALPGWAGLARWRTEWAHPTETVPRLRPIEVAAVRAMLEAAVLLALEPLGVPSVAPTADDAPAAPALQDDMLDERVEAVLARLGLPGDAITRAGVRDILALVPDPMRGAIWQRAQEHRYQTGLLGRLDRPAPEVSQTAPRAQVAFCIDVRSEGLRRHLEAQGLDETLGFAGFFGIPMQVRELGWANAEPRCPVLVAPSASVVEQPLVDRIADAARALGRSGLTGTVAGAHAETKHVPGAAFATAESLGWMYGPYAAWRTLVKPKPYRPVASSATSVTISDDMGIEQRIFSAESVLRTMGLTGPFAELVVLCGHASATVNNAHATALECGACAGASGASNARAVAALLNESDVRAGLADRGIDIPDETWFTGAVHDTASDRITVLDRHLAPTSHLQAIDELQHRLLRAGELRAAERAGDLPGAHGAADVQARGRDWAQVRPEWGLATNAAFVIGPRSMTADVDLDGRAFLHSYDAAGDPDGTVLEAIMTAPLVVGHWISAQYYFATVDSERFGAGDKLLHNPIGSIGVVTGARGDLRVGLPAQSTHVGARPYHQPLRLLAVIEADPAMVEAIIARNEVLARLVRGSWLHVAARSSPDTDWSTRSPGGTWSQLPRRASRSLERN